jgi:nitrite reductase/ring-hydroxylating ferredoxin subunit
MTTAVPHWLPTGWFQIGWTRDFPAGSVTPLTYFGRELVAFRGENGQLRVLDAFCRHLGAHLGYGGRVEGDCLVCPFHGWAWDGEGRNTDIPYQEGRPSRARMYSWPVHEADEVVYIWHDLEGRAPSWPVPSVFRDTSDHLAGRVFRPATPNGLVYHGVLPMHPQLVFENAADPAHFRYVHGTRDIPVFLRLGAEDERWYSTIGFGRRWRAMEPDSHDGDLLAIVGAGIGLTYTSLGGSDNTVILVSATPVDTTTSAVFQTVWLEELPGDDEPGRLDARLAAATSQLPNDIRIWRHQAFVDPPALATMEARAFRELRRWAEQFYPDADDVPRVRTAPPPPAPRDARREPVAGRAPGAIWGPDGPGTSGSASGDLDAPASTGRP